MKEALVRFAREARRRWRRSLQVRVVMLTALLGLVVSLLLGTYLYQRIGNGLERDRIEASSYEAQTLVSAVQAQWDTSTAKTLDDLNTVTRDLINAYLAPPGPNPSRFFFLALSR